MISYSASEVAEKQDDRTPHQLHMNNNTGYGNTDMVSQTTEQNK